MRITPAQVKQIGDTIRSVAAAHSARLFKSEKNTLDRAAFAFAVIAAEIALALNDLGLTIYQITQQIDPTDLIIEAMLQAGFPLNDAEIEYTSSIHVLDAVLIQDEEREIANNVSKPNHDHLN